MIFSFQSKVYTQNGEATRCANCQSINHWAFSGPDAAQNNCLAEDDEQTLFKNSDIENGTLFEFDLDAGKLNSVVAEILDATGIDYGVS